jgi:hypothetical protein
LGQTKIQKNQIKEGVFVTLFWIVGMRPTKVNAQTYTFTNLPTTKPIVYRNGLRQAEPEDYTITTANQNTLNIPLGQDGDVIVMDLVPLGNSMTNGD